MQANQASEKTTSELKEWFSKPGTGTEAGLGTSTQQALQWLEKSKDLTSVELRDKERVPSIEQEEAPSEQGGRANISFFMALFSCAGKRK